MIHVSIDSNEAMRPRAELIRKAIETDDRFVLSDGRFETPFDLRFDREEINESAPSVVYLGVRGDVRTARAASRRTLHVEIKDFGQNNGSDYLSSILSGHLWEQCQAAREIGEPFVIAVLGGDEEVNAACKAAASRKHRLDVEKMLKYFAMVDGFEANAIGQGIQVWRLKTDPYGRLLLRARKILEGGNLSGFAPHPAPGERKAVALSILAGDGIGPAKANNILQKFDICLMVKDGCLAELEDCSGIGPKLASRIRENIEVMD